MCFRLCNGFYKDSGNLKWVATLVRENMMELMRENKVKKKDLRKRKEEFMSGLKEGMNMMKFKISWMRMHI